MGCGCVLCNSVYSSCGCSLVEASAATGSNGSAGIGGTADGRACVSNGPGICGDKAVTDS